MYCLFLFHVAVIDNLSRQAVLYAHYTYATGRSAARRGASRFCNYPATCKRGLNRLYFFTGISQSGGGIKLHNTLRGQLFCSALRANSFHFVVYEKLLPHLLSFPPSLRTVSLLWLFEDAASAFLCSSPDMNLYVTGHTFVSSPLSLQDLPLFSFNASEWRHFVVDPQITGISLLSQKENHLTARRRTAALER